MRYADPRDQRGSFAVSLSAWVSFIWLFLPLYPVGAEGELVAC